MKLKIDYDTLRLLENEGLVKPNDMVTTLNRNKYGREYYHKNKEKQNERLKSFRRNTPEYSKNWEAKKRKLKTKDMRLRKYFIAKLPKINRSSFLGKRTPPWLNRTDIGKIKRLLTRANKLGNDYYVDYIVPLKSDDCCGLNVPWNMKVTNET